jgi:hypothetical protein
LAAVSIFVIRGVVRWSGYPFVGDWVPIDRNYAAQSLYPWNSVVHNGTFNANLRLIWLFVPLGHLAGQIGSWSFALANSAFLAIVAIAPIASASVVLRRTVRRSTLVCILSLFYGLNPWITAQNASGHVGIVLGYALLPLVVFPPELTAKRSAIRLGVLFAVIFDLDPHMGFVAAVCVGTSFLLRRARMSSNASLGYQIHDFAQLGISAAVVLACSLYWLIPDISATNHLTYVPITGHEPQWTLKSLSQFDDLYHVLGVRSFWWAPFSNGFYGHAVLGIILDSFLVVGPLWILIRAIYVMDKGKSLILPMTWIAVFLLMTQSAFYSVAIYERIVSLPGGSLFRDPNELTPLFILGLLLIAIEFQDKVFSAVGVVLLSVTVVTSLLPWLSGDLSSYLRPVKSVGEQAQAISWINEHAGGNSTTLWLPADSYLKTDWSTTMITDPVSSWSTVPVINPLEDPAYDFSPSTTLATADLESLLGNGQDLGGLGHALSASGIRYVVVRRDSQPQLISTQYARSLATAQGVRLVRTFGGEEIFRMPDPVRMFATVSLGATLYGGTWTDLESALYLDPRDRQTYVNIGGLGSEAALMSAHSTSLFTSNVQASAIQIGVTKPIPQSSRDQGIVVDNEVMYLFTSGQQFVTHSDGFFAIHLLGLNEGTTEYCNGRIVSSLAVNQQPDIGYESESPRWLGFNCIGSAVVRFTKATWAGGFQTSTLKDYLERIATIEALLGHRGSTFVVSRNEFSMSSKPLGALSLPQDLLFLPPGRYRVVIECYVSCPSAGIRILIPTLGLPSVTSRLRSGELVDIREPVGRSLLQSQFRMLLSGVDITRIRNVYLEREPQLHLWNAGTINSTDRQIVSFIATSHTSVITLMSSPAPWLSSGVKIISGRALIANMFGDAVVVKGRSGSLSLNYLWRAEVVGSILSGVALIGSLLVIIVFETSDRRRRGQLPDLTNDRD